MTPQERANSIFEGRGSHQLAKDTLKAIIAAENDALDKAERLARACGDKAIADAILLLKTTSEGGA